MIRLLISELENDCVFRITQIPIDFETTQMKMILNVLITESNIEKVCKILSKGPMKTLRMLLEKLEVLKDSVHVILRSTVVEVWTLCNQIFFYLQKFQFAKQLLHLVLHDILFQQ